MGKNANKKAKFKPIVFEIRKDVFKKALGNVLKHKSNEPGTILNSVKFEIADNCLYMASTDGSTLLESKIQLEETIEKDVETVLRGEFLEKMRLNNAYEFSRKTAFKPLDRLEITINEHNAIIADIRNNIKYEIPALDTEKTGRYPNYRNLIPKNNKKSVQKVCVDSRKLAKFAECGGDNKDPLVITTNPTKPLSVILIESEAKNAMTTYTGLLMPMQQRN